MRQVTDTWCDIIGPDLVVVTVQGERQEAGC